MLLNLLDNKDQMAEGLELTTNLLLLWFPLEIDRLMGDALEELK